MILDRWRTGEVVAHGLTLVCVRTLAALGGNGAYLVPAQSLRHLVAT